ncbi:MAG: AMP-binding protein [Christensenellales bacterium]
MYDHKAVIQIREGYGTTECVTASCLTPPTMHSKGSIGLPFPDTYYKIVTPGTDEELPYGEEGEILLAGPTVMREYLHHPEETAQTLRRHADGLTWVYTGDLGVMDADGFVYFRGRRERMIITSGYNVYPAQLENILEAHEAVQRCCIIGVPDSYKMRRSRPSSCSSPASPPPRKPNRAFWPTAARTSPSTPCPMISNSAENLPTTLVGKVAYRVLEDEELKKSAKFH